MKSKIQIAVAVTGASGSIYAEQLLRKLSTLIQDTSSVAVVMSDNAKLVWQTERGNESFNELPFPIYDKKDFMSPIASGSSGCQTMVICPCSMGTLGRIASGISDDLITRGADVCLKERRRLILVTRESPLNLIHINNMKTVTEAGGIILPASPSFYSNPVDLEAATMTVVDRIIDMCGVRQDAYRWGEES